MHNGTLILKIEENNKKSIKQNFFIRTYIFSTERKVPRPGVELKVHKLPPLCLLSYLYRKPGETIYSYDIFGNSIWCAIWSRLTVYTTCNRAPLYNIHINILNHFKIKWCWFLKMSYELRFFKVSKKKMSSLGIESKISC